MGGGGLLDQLDQGAEGAFGVHEGDRRPPAAGAGHLVDHPVALALHPVEGQDAVEDVPEVRIDLRNEEHVPVRCLGNVLVQPADQVRLPRSGVPQHWAETAALEATKADISFGSQIRNYVLAPYRLVKDARTKLERGDVDAVLDGDIDDFIKAYLLARRAA